MDKMFGKKKLSLGGFKTKMENATQEFNTGWKNITDKAKKEAKIVNKKARKVLELEDGGALRNDYILAVNLDAGHNVFKKFQNNWATMHEESIVNVKKADYADHLINGFAREYQKSTEYLNEFQGNLLALPDVLAKVEIAQNRIDTIGKQVKLIEGILLEYEDACETLDLEKQKVELKVKLSQLIATKHAEYTLKKSIVHGTTKSQRSGKTGDDETIRLVASPTPVNTKEYDKQNSMEKQRAYQDAFLDQMNQYIKFGELEKPIAGSASEFSDDVTASDNIEIGELDLSTLREFLGPEEINSVLQASASQSKSIKESISSDDLSIDKEIIVEKDKNITPSEDKHIGVAIEKKETLVEMVEKQLPVSKVENEPTVMETQDSTTEVDDSLIKTPETEPVIDIVKDIEPDATDRKPSAASDDEFFDAASDNED